MRYKKQALLGFAVSVLWFVSASTRIIFSNTIDSVEEQVAQSNAQPHNTLIVFDVDDTILVQDFYHQQALPVQDHVASSIASLQQRGFTVIGLTARPASLLTITKQQLAWLGINLTQHAPPNNAVPFSREGMVYHDGVILCGTGPHNQTVKGIALRDFLQATNNKYRQVISIDDQRVNLIAQEQSLEPGGVTCIGIEYGGFNNLVHSYAKTVTNLFAPKTATGAHLRSKEDEHVFYDYLVTFFKNRIPRIMKHETIKKVIQTIAERENSYANAADQTTNTHCVFYSGVPPKMCYFQDILQVFYAVFKGEYASDWQPLRLPYHEFETIGNVVDLARYHRKEDKKNGKQCAWDMRPTMRRISMAANPSLFKNINANSGSESALDYFFYPRLDGGANKLLATTLSIEEFLVDLCAEFGLQHFFTELKKLLIDPLDPQAGPNPLNAYFDLAKNTRLLQIFVPNTMVDRYVYFCILRGKPYHQELHTSDICNLLKHDITKLYPHTSPVKSTTLEAPMRQVRILLHPKLFGSPKQGVKIFSYHKEERSPEITKAYFDYLYATTGSIKERKEKEPLTKHHTLTRLLTDFKHYKTNNIGFHSGDLYEHSWWVANAVTAFAADPNNVWCQGLDQQTLECCYLAALIHDVGKAGDQVFNYFEKPTHPHDGFLYLTGKKQYHLQDGTPFDFAAMFDNLQVNKTQKAIIAILAGIHWDFGILMRDGATEQAMAHYLKKLAWLCKEAAYNNGNVDETMLKLSILITAADVKGCQPVDTDGKPVRGLQPCCCHAPHHSGVNQFDALSFETKGIQVRHRLLDFFNKHQAEQKTTAAPGQSPDQKLVQQQVHQP